MNSSQSDSLIFLPDGYVDSPTSFLSDSSTSTTRGSSDGFPFVWEGQQSPPISANTSLTSSVSLSSLDGFRFGSQSSSSCSSSLLEHRSTVSSSSETSSEGTSSSSFCSGPSFSFTPPYPNSPLPSTPSSSTHKTYSTSITRSPSRSSKPLLHIPLSNQTAPIPPSLIARRGSLPASNAIPFHLPPPTFTATKGSNGHQGLPPAPSSWSWSARPELQGIPSPLRMEYNSDELVRGEADEEDDVHMDDLELGRRKGSSPSRNNGSPSPLNGNRGGAGTGNYNGIGRGKASGPFSWPYGRGGSSRKMSLPTHFSSHTTTTYSSSSSSSTSSSPNLFATQPAVSSTALMSRSTFTLGNPPHGGKQPLSPESPTTQLHPLPHHLQPQYQQHQQQQHIKQPAFPPALFLHQQPKPNNSSGYPFPPQQKPHTPPATPRTALSNLPPPYQKSVSSQGSTSAATPSPPPPPPPPPAAPTTISATLLDGHDLNPLFESRYTLTSSLGSGGYGFVCVATELATRREVAVKFILASKVPPHAWVAHGGEGEVGDGMPPAGGKVPMECQILRRVHHWGVVQGLGVFCDGKFFYLVQELHGDSWGPSTPGTPTASSTASLPPLPLNGLGPPSPFAPSFALPASPYIGPSQGASLPASPITPIRPSINMERRGSCDLFECVERHKKFGEARARMIFKQIVETVSFLSRMGIYHRDIKDENLVIDRDYHVKLIDFGSAVWEKDPEHPRMYKEFFGTTAYASPEIITGHQYYAAEAEVWSLGILLCILVTGESPFSSPKEAQIGRRSALRNGLRMSRELIDLVDRCLEVSPERRITIQEMRGHRWLGGGATQ